MKRYLFIPILIFCILFSSFNVSALYYPDWWELEGLTYDEFLDALDEDGIYTGYYSSSFSVVNPTYQKDFPMSCSISWYEEKQDYPFYAEGLASVGEYKLIGNRAVSVRMTLGSNGQPLFEYGGSLTLLVYVYSHSATYTVYRSNGSTYSYQFVAQNPNAQVLQIPIEFDNSNNDIVKIEFLYNYGHTQSTGDTKIGFGIVDYGYISSVAPPEPEIPDLTVKGDLADALYYLTSVTIDIVDSLFLLEVFAGISLGTFILCSILLSIVFAFLFARLVR